MAMTTDEADIGPDWLDDMGRHMWRAIAPDLRTQGLLRPAEEIPLARYCDALSRWHAVRARVTAFGETYETESRHGKLRRISPDFAVMDKLESWLAAFEDRFALSPMMRMKLKALRQNVGEGDAPAVRTLEMTPTHAPDEPDPVPASPFGAMLQ